MSLESIKFIVELLGALAVGLTFICAIIAVLMGNRINKEQKTQIRELEKGIADASLGVAAAQTELAEQQERAANAESRLAGLEGEATQAKTEMAEQQTKAAKAEQALIDLKERVKPRRLTDQQAIRFIATLKTMPNMTIDLGCTAGGGDEALGFARQLLPIFKNGGWTVRNGIKSHLEIQLIGIGLLARIPAGTDPLMLRFRDFPASETIANSIKMFKEIGMDMTILNYHPEEGDVPEIVIGSKPEPPIEKSN